MTMTLDETRLADLRRRRKAGERLAEMARPLGITWQKLDKAIRNGLPGNADRQHRRPARPREKAGKASGPDRQITERHRPRTLDGLVGQPAAVRQLRAFSANPYPTAFLLEGYTGTGKTTAALALAAAVGCDMDARPEEFGGVHTIASGDQTADTIRDLYKRLWACPFSGTGWKVLIVNEADRMRAAAETVWLDRLERMPPRTVICFTTNDANLMAARFRDRCTRIVFVSDAETMMPAGQALAMRVWRAELGRKPTPADRLTIDAAVERSVENGQLSLRRVVQNIGPVIETIRAGGAKGA